MIADPPVATWLEEAFDETLARLAAARAYWEDLRWEGASLSERSAARHQLERIRQEMDPLRLAWQRHLRTARPIALGPAMGVS